MCKVRSAGLVAASALVLSAAYTRGPADETRPPSYGYRVVKAYPHDPEAYTQGLAYRDGFLLRKHRAERAIHAEESEPGDRRKSSSRRVSIRGTLAEGLADWNGRLVQLTWQSGPHLSTTEPRSGSRTRSATPARAGD